MKISILMGSKIYRITILLLAILLLSSIDFVSGQEDYEPNELSIIIYSDGYVSVDYVVDVDPTKVQVNVTLFGSIYLDMLIEDQDGGGLDYYKIDNGITIDTVGSISALISYFTTDLTSKIGQIWSFNIVTPISCTIILPEDATLTYSNMLPSEMGSLNGNPYMVMPAGEISIDYSIGPVGTREHAQALISDAENTIDEIKSEDILVPEAEALLNQAKGHFDEEKYVEAEQLATLAKSLAQDTQNEAINAQNGIMQAESAISDAISSGRTNGLETAQNLLEQAQLEYINGNYTIASDLAEQSETASKTATIPVDLDEGISILWLTGGAFLIAAVAGVVYIIRKKTEDTVKKVEKASFDLESLFREFSHLRMDDKEVIRYLAESGGESFAAEIRERFEIPRTSLWRMIRRLEGEGVIIVENIGGQSLVKINSEYRLEKSQ